MKCPCCGAAELVHDVRSVDYVYRGQETSIPAVEGDFCPACGEAVLDRHNGNRFSALIGAYQARIDKGALNAAVKPGRMAL